MPLPLQDRLKLTKGRIEAMAEGLRQLVELEEPVGEVSVSYTHLVSSHGVASGLQTF